MTIVFNKKVPPFGLDCFECVILGPSMLDEWDEFDEQNDVSLNLDEDSSCNEEVEEEVVVVVFVDVVVFFVGGDFLLDVEAFGWLLVNVSVFLDGFLGALRGRKELTFVFCCVLTVRALLRLLLDLANEEFFLKILEINY